jgi:hypothetical protein
VIGAARLWAHQDPAFEALLNLYFTSEKTLRLVLPPPPPVHPAVGPLLVVAVAGMVVALEARLGRRLTGSLSGGASPG